MNKVDTAYLICDPRKFTCIEDAERELNRLRQLCIRLKKQQSEDVRILLGLSIVNSAFLGIMGYDKPKNQGGKKQFICKDRVRRIDKSTGERVFAIPDYTTEPHIHVLIVGFGANTIAEKLKANLKKQDNSKKYRKEHLKTAERVEQVTEYITNQSIVKRHV